MGLRRARVAHIPLQFRANTERTPEEITCRSEFGTRGRPRRRFAGKLRNEELLA
jgi:hypothetical protein